MNDGLPIDLLERLEKLPNDTGRRSKMQPYCDVILRWRRQEKSYRTIQRILSEECKVSVSHKAIIKFVKLRTRPRKQAEPDLVTATPTAAESHHEAKPSLAEQKAAQFAAKQALMEKSHAPGAEEKPLFAFGWDQQSTRDRKG